MPEASKITFPAITQTIQAKRDSFLGLKNLANLAGLMLERSFVDELKKCASLRGIREHSFLFI